MSFFALNKQKQHDVEFIGNMKISLTDTLRAMGKMLCVIRESANENFIGYIIRLARDLKSHVHVSYVEEEYEYTIGRPPAPGNYAGGEQSKRVSQARRILSERIQKVLGELENDVSVDYSADLASVTSVIDDFISSEDPDIVVMEGEDPGGMMFTATSVDELIDEVRHPVLLVPGNIVYRPWRQILYATAYNEKDIPAIKDLVRITSVLKPSVRVLHITDDSGRGEQLGRIRFVEILQKETGYQGITVEHLEEKKNEGMADQIMDYAIQVNTDLLVVLKDERNFFERIFTPDKTKKIIKNPDIPVMIYKP